MSCESSDHASVDAWLESAGPFARPICQRLIKIIRSAAPYLTEGIRWGMPSWKGRELVCGIGAFQKHVSLTFWRGAEVPDPAGLLVHGEGKTAMRSAKFTALDQVNERTIRAWITAAAALDREGSAPRAKREPLPEPEVPEALARALKKNAKARQTFSALRPSHRREYCEWIAGAKQPATAERRVAKALEMLESGKGLNDKYR